MAVEITELLRAASDAFEEADRLLAQSFKLHSQRHKEAAADRLNKSEEIYKRLDGMFLPRIVKEGISERLSDIAIRRQLFDQRNLLALFRKVPKSGKSTDVKEHFTKLLKNRELAEEVANVYVAYVLADVEPLLKQ